jgi:hypothetical protein
VSQSTLFATSVPFSYFWTAYPRRVGKADAERAWNKLKPSPVQWETMKSTLTAQCRSRQWQEKEKIPHPATWLNAKRWEDEVESIVPASTPPRPSTTRRWQKGGGKLTAQEGQYWAEVLAKEAAERRGRMRGHADAMTILLEEMAEACASGGKLPTLTSVLKAMGGE